MRPIASPSLLLCLLAAVAFARAAAASEESQALGARAAIEMNAGHGDRALELLDRAVAADPNDPDVRYQRGAARAKLGNTSGAIEDLRAALANRPDFPEAQLELGAALIEAGQYQEAETYLTLARRTPALEGPVSFFLGVVQLRGDRLAEAQQSFERAQSHDPELALASRYYLGVIAYRQHAYDTAESQFAAVSEAAPTAAIGREATDFLALIRRSRRAAFWAFGTIGLEYDSNVTLGPSSSNVVPGAITGQGDGRAVINAGAHYAPLSQGRFGLALGYEFFQSLQFHLTDFNLEDHRPSVQLTYDLDKFLIGALARYDYYLLSTSSFMQEATAFPWVAAREDGIGRTELFLRIQWRDYKLHAINDTCPTSPPCNVPGFTQLDGFYNFAGVRQYIDLGAPDRQLWFGYQLGFENPDNQGSAAYQYGSHALDIALRWPLPYAIVGEAGFRWENQNYAPQSASLSRTGSPRRDNDYRAVTSFERHMTEIDDHLFLNAAWYGTFNDSNNVLFQYDRQIGSIAAEVRF
jgi:tetratricopeptide (TPR) repeat protein